MKDALPRFVNRSKNERIIYRPIVFILSVYVITWLCAFIIPVLNNGKWSLVLALLDFTKSASPLIAALFLLRNYITDRYHLARFFFGENKGLTRYIIVALLFILQFLNFYMFRIETAGVSLSAFVLTFGGQIVFGGALEEGGWRGYLQPAFERKLPTVIATMLVGIVWACWHIPYFIIPGNMHSGGNFLFYVFTAVFTSFILTAIHKLTGSVLLCSLFHGWQNTIVMTVQADMSNLGFMAFFILLGATSIGICLYLERIEQ